MYGYYCLICSKTHQMNSKIGKEHYEAYLLNLEKEDRRAQEERSKTPPRTKEEVDRILYKLIYGD